MNVVDVFGNFQDHATLACLIWDSFNQIYGLERSQLPNLVNGLESTQLNEYTLQLDKFYVKTPLKHYTESSHLANTYMVLKGVNCLTWEMVLKEANRMNTQCNQIRQVLCKNSIEMLCRELTFGKYIVN